MLAYPATVRCVRWELVATFSPMIPSAVIAFATKLTFVKVGFADTDISVGVEDMLSISTSVSGGDAVPCIVRPCAASLSRVFEIAKL